MDRLEEEEQWQIERLKKLVLPDNIPSPVGMDDSKKFALNAQQSKTGADSDAVLLGSGISVPQQLSFWDRHYQSVVNGTVGKSQKRDPRAQDNNDGPSSDTAAAAAAMSPRTSTFKSSPSFVDKRALLLVGHQRDRSLASTPTITMSAYKKRNMGRKRMAAGSDTMGKESSSGIATFPTPRGTDTNGDSQMLFESNSSFAVSSHGNVSNSMMSMSGSQDDTTFDAQYGDEDDEDDEEMEE